MNAPDKAKRLVGFARMSREMRAYLGRQGGLKAAQMGVGHKFDSDEARSAARKRHAAK